MKLRYHDDTIEEFVSEEKLKKDSGLKVVTNKNKSVYINNEDYLEKFCKFLKKKAF